MSDDQRRILLQRLRKVKRLKQEQRTRAVAIIRKSKPISQPQYVWPPNEFLQDVFAKLSVQQSIFRTETESLRAVAACLQVCKRWNRILRHKFPGNPLFDSYNWRLYVLTSAGQVMSGDKYFSDVLVKTNKQGEIVVLKRRDNTPYPIQSMFSPYLSLFCMGNGVAGLRYV